MNKKTIISFMGIFLFAVSANIVSPYANESYAEKNIRKNLEFLFENGAITYSQLTEKNGDLVDIIDRDIMIMETYKKQLHGKIQKNKGFWMQICSPFGKTMKAFCFGGISLFSCACAYRDRISFDLLENKELESGIFAIISISFFIKLLKSISFRYSHFSDIEKSTKKCKQKIEQSNTIIACLKALKYRLNQI